jgi:perosamine synthetase
MIYVSEPSLGQLELEYVQDCLNSGWISSAGRYIEEFEREWAHYCGMKYGIAVSNGTTALQVAVGTLKLQPGDEIIMPSFTIISCALAAIYNGCVPVLVDSDPLTWCMDVSQIEKKISNRTKAIMPVHIYGHPVDMDSVREIAQRLGIAVIEDAAEAHGAEYKGRRCGGLVDLSCFSFYANKILTTGEGGMVLTNSEETAERARSLRNLCFLPHQRFLHTELGHNFRLTNIQAAIGLAQLKTIDERVSRKRWIGSTYNRLLANITQLGLPVEQPWARSVYWMYGVLLSEEVDMNAAEFAEKLARQGVETRPFFLGMHQQPVLLERGLFCGESYPVTERLAKQGLYLPSGLTLTEDQIEYVCEVVRSTLP